MYERVSETIKSTSAYKHADTVISTVNNIQSMTPGDRDEISPLFLLPFSRSRGRDLIFHNCAVAIDIVHEQDEKKIK